MEKTTASTMQRGSSGSFPSKKSVWKRTWEDLWAICAARFLSLMCRERSWSSVFSISSCPFPLSSSVHQSCTLMAAINSLKIHKQFF